MAKGGKKNDKPKSEKVGGPAPRPSDGFTPKTELTDDERQALHFRHVKEWEKALGAKKAADAEMKNVGKRIKSEGGDVKLCKLTVELRTEEGTTEFRERMAREAEVANWNGVGVQIDLFGDAREPAADRAYSNGKRAGMNGEPARPPHSPETEQYREWMRGHGDGNEALARSGFKAPASEEDRDLRPPSLQRTDAERAGDLAH